MEYNFKGGDNEFTFQCHKDGTLTEEGKPCPRCGGTEIDVYAKPQMEGMEALLRN